MVLISVYICCSKDGFIADKSGGVGWIPPMSPGAQKSYEDYVASVDMIIMGSRSYEKVLSFGMGWPYAGKSSVVFSKRPMKTERDDIEVSSENPAAFVNRINSVKKCWLMGGAELIKSFEEQGLIDEVILFTVPKELKEGLSLDLDLKEFELAEEGSVDELPFKTFKRTKK